MLLLLAGVIIHSCDKNRTVPCRNGGYAFLGNGVFAPENENVRIGDTLRFYSELPYQQQDQINPNLLINYSNSTLIGGNFLFFKLDSTDKKLLPAGADFLSYSVQGSLTNINGNANAGLNYFYADLQSGYKLKLNILPQQEGLYAIIATSALSNGLRGKNCTNASFDITVTNTNKHLQLYQSAIGRMPDAQTAKQIYCFRVQ